MGVCLIPAAGFGKRVGSPLSKEMLIDPVGGAPLIDWAIEQALENNLKPLIITRKEKTNLLEHLKTHWPSAEVFLIDASREWPQTLWLSEKHWDQVNLLLLPDTRFAPVEILSQLLRDCREGVDVSFASFKVDDLRTWGVIDLESELLRICEKPLETNLNPKVFAAWGLFAFRKSCGLDLFAGLLESNLSHAWVELNLRRRFHELHFFKDITRAPSDLEPSKS